MVKQFIFLGLLCSLTGIFGITNLADISQSETKPLVTIALMVKDEEPVIEATLQTYIGRPEVAFFIFDTGSTDNTLQVAEDFFKKHNIKHYAFGQEPFINFAASRNRGLRLAEKAFPSADFIVMPDAEWYMSGLDTLVEFCKQEKNAQHPVYLMDITAGGIDFTTPRLIRTHKNICFEGVVHEAIATTGVRCPKEVIFNVGASKYGVEKSRQRWVRDAQALLKFHKENPQDSRTLFYLAQTYQCLDDLENAQKYYALRVKVHGWDEEDFMAWYRLAQVTEELSERNKDQDLWALSQNYYLKAHSFRPKRAEPLVRLADHYRKKDDFALSYLFARIASEIPCPHEETLFLEKDLYTFSVHDILGIVCWYHNKYELGEFSVRNALKDRPDMPHLLKNLSLYLERRCKVL